MATPNNIPNNTSGGPSNLGLPAANVPFVDSNGMVRREWRLFLQNLQLRVGGNNSISLTDVIGSVQLSGPAIFADDSGAYDEPAGFNIGAQGPAGVNGLNGSNGVDGLDGEDSYSWSAGPTVFPQVSTLPIQLYSVTDDNQADVLTETMAGAYSNAPNFWGTATFGDGSTWNATGVSDVATYSTSTVTAPVNFAYNVSYSSTAGGVTGLALSPTMSSVGASSGNMSLLAVAPNVGSSANNIGTVRGIYLTPATVAGYTGVVTTFNCLEINPTLSGTQNAPTLNRIKIDTNSGNGNGITSGTVTNNGMVVSGDSVAAGAGGTVVNNGLNINLSTGSSAGTVNAGIFIQGSGGASSTNYAIQSTSTAPCLFSGPITQTVPGNVAASVPTIASAATIAPTTPIVFVSGTTTISTITVPAGSTNGTQITLIPTGLFSTNTAGNIALASGSVVSRALIMTYAASTGKWYPSY